MRAPHRYPWAARLAGPLALTAVLAAGCSGGDADPDVALDRTSPPVATSPTSLPSPSPSSDLRAWATCTTERADLRVSYPADWQAGEHSQGGCAYFDPQPFDVVEGAEAPSVAVRLDVENIPYEQVRDAYLRGEVISQREVEVAGYDGIRIEDRDTGGPLAAKGRRLTYLADLPDGRTLVLTTNETDADDPGPAREVLEQMADRIEPLG